MYIPLDIDIFVDQSTGWGENILELWVGRLANGDMYKTLIHFPVSSLPSASNTTLTSASLQIYSDYQVGLTNLPINIYRLSSSFSNSTNWPGPANGSLVWSGDAEPGGNTIDITPYLNDVWQGGSSNYGLALRPNFSGFSTTMYHRFRSREAASLQPEVHVLWSCP